MHGCAGLFDAVLGGIRGLHAQRGDAGKPRLILLGDLVDRGPDSRAVLDTVISRAFHQRFDATILKGNHEDMFLTAAGLPHRHFGWLDVGGQAAVESYGVVRSESPTDTQRDFAAALPTSHVKLLREMPLSIREAGIFFCHAGIDPLVPLAAQRQQTLLWGCGRDFLDETTSPEAMIVHGHYPSPSAIVDVTPDRIGVDTGAGFVGGRLSAVVFTTDGRTFTLSAEPAPEDFDIPRCPAAWMDAIAHPPRTVRSQTPRHLRW